MTSNHRALLILIVITFISLGVYSFQSYRAQTATPQTGQTSSSSSSSSLSTFSLPNTNPIDSDSIQSSEAVLAGTGFYKEYSPELDLPIQGSVLFFHAKWCPSCKSLDTDISANLLSIPAGLTIYKVDYDSNQALRQKYGITTQHTLVKVDGEGELIKKEAGLYQLEKLDDVVNFYQS
jgi:thiol-disulfide isomerase/thioredoxin